MSKSSILDKATRFLVGSEKLSPEVTSLARKYVSETGRINHEALGSRKLLGDLLIGKRGTLDALRGRYTQGGVFGPGGLVAGELALDPKFKQLLANYRSTPLNSRVIDPYTGNSISRARAMGNLVTRGLGESINPLFMVGFPALEVSEALNTPDHDERGGMSGVLGALGGGLGFAVAGPLGLIGSMGAGHLGQQLGSSLGGLYDPVKKQSTPTAKYSSLSATPVLLDAAIPLRYTSTKR